MGFRKGPRVTEAFLDCGCGILNLSDRILERLSGLEGGELHGWDLDLLAWVARVDTRAGGALADTEGAKAGDGHAVSLFEGHRDGRQGGFESLGRGLLGDAGSLGGGIDEILLRHGTEGLVIKLALIIGQPEPMTRGFRFSLARKLLI